MNGQTHLDMTMIHVVHNAFRRDAQRLHKVTESADVDARRAMRAGGWGLFTRLLRRHFHVVDAVLCPMMQIALAGRSDAWAEAVACEADHITVQMSLDIVDTVLQDPDTGPVALGIAADGLTAALHRHLDRAECETLPLVGEVLPEPQWSQFRAEYRLRMAGDEPLFLPWLLESASADHATHILSELPEATLRAYLAQWRADYLERDLWAHVEPSGAPGTPDRTTGHPPRGRAARIPGAGHLAARRSVM